MNSQLEHQATMARGLGEEPLKVVIIGAGMDFPRYVHESEGMLTYQGIGGLTAAIGLRQQGHEVTVSLHFHALGHSPLD